MRAAAALIAGLALLAQPLFAQEAPPDSPGAKFVPAPPGVTYGEQPSRPGYIEELIEAERPDWRSVTRPVALLRGLDKISGRVTDIRAPVGEKVVYERLTIEVEECREPPEGELADAFVFMKIEDAKTGGGPVFSGWMFASSPALSAMDHQRYDVWVLSCATS